MNIDKIEQKNRKYYASLAKFFEPYDRHGNPLRKGLPLTLEEFRAKGKKR